MSPLDVITLADAKQYIKVDFDDDDLIIESLISGAVSLVEQHTQYRLYNRSEIVYTSKVGYDAFQFPILGANVVSQNSADTNTYTIRQHVSALRTKLFWGIGFEYFNESEQFWNNDYYAISNPCLTTYTLTLNVGYTDASLIPNDLLTAVKMIVVFTYENRDLTRVDMPANIMLLLAPYRRFLTFI